MSETDPVGVEPEAAADYLGEYEYGVVVHLTDQQQLAVRTDFNDFHLIAVSGQPDTFIVPDALAVVQFQNTGGQVEVTIASIIVQDSMTLRKIR